MSKINVVLAEDNVFLAKSIKDKLKFFEDLSLKFRVSNGAELIGKLEQDHNVDVILMDIEMPLINGIQATEMIRQKYPHINIIMLTIHDSDEMIFKAIKAGANGYLLKEEIPSVIHNGILEVINGGAPMSPSIAYKALKMLRSPITQLDVNDDCNLTKREVEILEHLSAGLTYEEIGTNLFISTGTVRKHIQNIYKKLQVRNKVEAVIKAKSKNIIQ